MSKTASTPLRKLQEQLQAVDFLFEIRDARLPLSSKHPKSYELFGQKARLIVFSKSDLADPEQLKAWVAECNKNSAEQAIALCLKTQKGQNKLLDLALELTADKRAALSRKGILQRPMRACVVGLPNVGKSSFINWLIGRKKAPVGNRPGITKGNHWVRLHSQLELLDTPGMLPSVSFSQETKSKLSLCNILAEEQYHLDEIALYGLKIMQEKNPQGLKIYHDAKSDLPVTLEQIAKARGCLLPGGKPDLRRASGIFINDFRSGKLGRIILDDLVIK